MSIERCHMSEQITQSRRDCFKPQVSAAMLFKAAILDKIARGEVTLAFRRWRKPDS
jgi:hypothetical protein